MNHRCIVHADIDAFYASIETRDNPALQGLPVIVGAVSRRGVDCALTVSLGIGPNKLVAKIACTLGKPNGLYVIGQHQAAELLAPLPVRRLWGIGQVTEKSLRAQGIATIGDLACTPLGQLESALGSRAQELQQMAQGFDERPVESNREHRSIGEECTFEHDTLEAAVIAATITTHSHAVARRLRKLQLRVHTITLKVKLARASVAQPNRTSTDADAPRYPLISRSKTLSSSVQDRERIRAVALELWKQANFDQPLRWVGVSVSYFEAAADPQLALFATTGNHERLGAALDAT